MYNPESLYNQAVEVLSNDPSIVLMQELFCYMPCSIDTFYNHFPVGSEKFGRIKELLHKNKIAIKQKLKKNWEKEDASATLQIALYKLLADEDELQRLSNNPQISLPNQGTINIQIAEQKGNEPLID